MALIEREMPVNRVAEILGINSQRVWTLFNHWVEKTRQADDVSSISQLGVDETSYTPYFAKTDKLGKL